MICKSLSGSKSAIFGIIGHREENNSNSGLVLAGNSIINLWIFQTLVRNIGESLRGETQIKNLLDMQWTM